MKRVGLLIGLMLLCCLMLRGAEYVGTLRMASGYTLENVRVELDRNGRLTLYRVKFARLMPVRVDVVMPRVSLQQQAGETVISGEDIVPTVNSKPHPNRVITRLRGKATKQRLVFSCLSGGKGMSFEGKIKQ